MKNDVRDLQLVLDARTRLVAIESWDEVQVLQTLTHLAMQRGDMLWLWSCTEGLQQASFTGIPDQDSREAERALVQVKNSNRTGIFVFCDLHPFMSEPIIVRLLKDIAMAQGIDRPTVILVSHALNLPVEIQRFAARFNVSLPSEDELLSIVREEAARWSQKNRGIRVQTDSVTLKQMVKNLHGMSHADARRLARKLICDDGAITQEDIPELNKAKFQLLNLDSVLSYESDTARFAEVGGLTNLKRWLGQRRSAFFGQTIKDMPKGMLLVGVQGGGKSLAAKAVAGLWGLPLLRLDFGSLYNKFFGETERNLREALGLADRMAPCVLWIDEIEKGISTSDLDQGVSQRVLGTLLTWMSERKNAVFVVATANNISRLPPELVRKGRFDEIFFVDLPKLEVRKEIFRIHLSKRSIEVSDFDLEQLAQTAEGFSGAEIEQAIVSSLYAGQARNVQIDQELLLNEIIQTSPLSVVMSEELMRLRLWAKDRTVSADE
ncbi:AAA family ATPase [Pseudomonas sp. F1_0610]|uniref:AAA family ATPase n=1 Tax=Pseudomonas sp. F1_0610 TaxID=3114284 RepID=UPI0039C47EF5